MAQAAVRRALTELDPLNRLVLPLDITSPLHTALLYLEVTLQAAESSAQNSACESPAFLRIDLEEPVLEFGI